MVPAKRGTIWAGQGTQPINACPCGACIWVPCGAPIIGRDFSFFFCRSSALRAPGSNGCPKGHPYAPPEGGALMGHPRGCPICAPVGCTLYNVCARVRVYVKPASRDLGHFTRDLGQNQRVTFCSVPLRDYFSLRAPPGPLIPFGDMGTLSGTHFKTHKN